MNVDTGHLVKLNSETARGVFGEPVTYEEIRRKGYEPVPPELERAAQMKLAGEKVNGFSEAWVSLTSGGKLSRWAAEKRKKKMAKESRRKNWG